MIDQLKDPITFTRRLGGSTDCPRQIASLLANTAAMVAALEGSRGTAVQELLGRIVRRVTVQENTVELILDTDGIMRALGLQADTVAAEELRITIPARIRRTGLALRFVLESGQHAAVGPVDQKLVVAIAKAKGWWKRLQAEPTMTVTDLAKAEGLAPNYIDRVLRLAFLSPVVVNASLSGTAPTEINLERLKDVKLIAPSWAQQHRLLSVATAQR